MSDPGWLPALMPFEEYGNDWSLYEKALYAIFCRDFLGGDLTFRGEPIEVGRQMIDGKERTFWHLTSEGKLEESRTPAFRRCERIQWVRAIIEHESDPAIQKWPNKRKGKDRFVLWFREGNFAVILEKRTNCWWLWTTYQTDWKSSQEDMEREYKEWLKSQRRP